MDVLKVTSSGCGCEARFVYRYTFNVTITSRVTDKRKTIFKGDVV